MKKYLIIVKLIIISLSIFSQEILLDSTGYKAFRLSIYVREKKLDYNSDVLFFIDNNKLSASVDKQFKKLYFISEPETDVITGHEVKIIQCLDNGGFYCFLTIGLDETSDTYFIVITYSDITFFYQCKITDERPWDSDPKDHIFEQQKYKKDPEYTEKEVDDFLRNFGDPKTIKNLIIKDFYREHMFSQ